MDCIVHGVAKTRACPSDFSLSLSTKKKKVEKEEKRGALGS